jgi:hypothetical protein
MTPSVAVVPSVGDLSFGLVASDVRSEPNAPVLGRGKTYRIVLQLVRMMSGRHKTPCHVFCCILTIPDRLECPRADNAAWTVA